MFRTIVFLVILITPVSVFAQGPILFEDDFSDGDYHGWSVVLGTWTAQNMKLEHLTSTPATNGSGRISTNVGNIAWTDYEVSVRVYPDANGEFDGDVYFRLEEDNAGGWLPTKCYRLFFKYRPIQSREIELAKVTNGVSETLGDKLLAHEAPYYDISITVRELTDVTSIMVNLNGQIISYNNSDPDRPSFGGIGFRSWYIVEGQSFDDVLVFDHMAVPAHNTTWGSIKALY